VWPLTKVLGCRFHLGQFWFQKIQSLGLQRVYRTRTGDGAFLRTFFALPFLKPADVLDCLLHDFMPNLPADDRILQFGDFVHDTYVVDGCLFPPTMWAAYDDKSVRTTNACEAFHSKLNGMFYHAHPHIFILIKALLEVQNLAYLKMRNPARGIVHPKQAIIADFDDGKLTRYEFVALLALKFQPKKKFLRKSTQCTQTQSRA